MNITEKNASIFLINIYIMIYSPFLIVPVCQLYGFSGGFFGLLSINALAAIALDRCVAITSLEHWATPPSRRHHCLKLLIPWLHSFFWAVPPLFGWNRYVPEGFQTTCSFDYLTRTPAYTSFVMAMFFGGFVVPMAVIVGSYIRIYAAVRRQKNDFDRTSRRLGSLALKKRVFLLQTARTCLWCVLLYCLAWTPYAAISILGEYGDQRQVTPLLSVLCGLFAKASTVYNPIVYAISHPKLRNKLPCCKPKAGALIALELMDRFTESSTYPLSRRFNYSSRSTLNSSVREGDSRGSSLRSVRSLNSRSGSLRRPTWQQQQCLSHVVAKRSLSSQSRNSDSRYLEPVPKQRDNALHGDRPGTRQNLEQVGRLHTQRVTAETIDKEKTLEE